MEKNVRVVTTLSQEYWDKVGQYSLSTWPSLMPPNWELWFHDTPSLPITPHRNLQSEEKELWYQSANKEVKGRPEPPGYQNGWGMFTHKVFAQIESYKAEPSGIMIWCDADVRWKKMPTLNLLDRALEGKFCAYLGRDRVDTSKTSKKKYKKLANETCILIYDLDHPAAANFFKNFENVYKSFRIFDHYDWSDCGGFEIAQNETGKEFFNDVTKNNPPAINPLPLSLYDEYFEHWMGWTNKNAREDISGKKEKEKILKRLTKRK